ncbi:MAG: helix-turn-helix transcriptional regulator [Candidatus Micrarchaeia archaeon]|jgi:putative transcriptional regulator
MISNLKDARLKAKLTQEQLADKVMVARQTILFLEKGEYNPSLKLAYKLSKLLGVKIENLFSFDDEKE